jgi:hypothetical protein
MERISKTTLRRYGHLPPDADAYARETARELADAINASEVPARAFVTGTAVNVVFERCQREPWPWPRASVMRLPGRHRKGQH